MNLLFEMPGGSEWLIIGLIFGIGLIVKIFYLLTLQSAFNTVSPENRKMPAGQMWLLLIPLFGLVWHFIVVNKLADSIKADADTLKIKTEEQRPAYNIGLAMCILICCVIIPKAGSIAAIAGVVCGIIYWVKISFYKNTITMMKPQIAESTSSI